MTQDETRVESSDRHHAPMDLEIANSLVADLVSVLAARALPIGEIAGCVLAEDILTPRAVPAFANTAMDGYAVRCAALQPAGETRWRMPIEAASPICTGQPIPDGMDAIVPIERVRVLGQVLEVDGPVGPGDHIRLAGEELGLGELALSAGTRLSPAALGLLSLLGLTRTAVVPRPKVAILVTGDEVVAPGAVLGIGQTYDANGTLLPALITESGGRVVGVERLPDDPARIAAAVGRLASRCDLLCTSGGASVGTRDHMAVVLAAQGRVIARELAIKPGRPTTFAIIDGTPVFALPGNPLALHAGFEALVRPTLLHLAGRTDLHRERLSARASAPIAHRPGRVEYVPVDVSVSSDGLVAQPIERRGSAMLSGLAMSGFVARLPAEAGPIAVGGAIVLERWSTTDCAPADWASGPLPRQRPGSQIAD